MDRKEVTIVLDATYENQEGLEDMKLNTDAVMEKDGSDYRFTYDDFFAGENFPTKTIVEIKDGIIAIERTGAVNTLLVMELDERHVCSYLTEHGTILMGVTAQRVENNLDGFSGSIEFDYTLDSNSSVVSKNTMKITVKERNEDN